GDADLPDADHRGGGCCGSGRHRHHPRRPRRSDHPDRPDPGGGSAPMTAATPAQAPLRIVLAEDSPLLRAGVEAVLARGGHEVVAAVGDGAALVDAVRATVPDLVITDVRMPPNHSDEGLRAAAQIRRERPSLPVIVLSQYVSVAYVDDLMAGGGRGLG